MATNQDKEWQFAASALHTGVVAVSTQLLQEYARLGISDAQLALLLHLISFWQTDHKEFPTPRELGERMSSDETAIIDMISDLIAKGLLAIRPKNHPLDGTLHDVYDIRPLYDALAKHLWQKQYMNVAIHSQDDPNHLYQVFEEEFGRPLSGMELEQITQWLDQDGYKPEVIKEALREAVLGSVYSVKYIDRILLDWQKKRIVTAEQAKSHRSMFRNKRSASEDNKGRQPTRQTQASDLQGKSDKYDAFYKLYKKSSDL